MVFEIVVEGGKDFLFFKMYNIKRVLLINL